MRKARDFPFEKKKNSARLWTAQKKEVRTEAASAPAP